MAKKQKSSKKAKQQQKRYARVDKAATRIAPPESSSTEQCLRVKGQEPVKTKKELRQAAAMKADITKIESDAISLYLRVYADNDAPAYYILPDSDDYVQFESEATAILESYETITAASSREFPDSKLIYVTPALFQAYSVRSLARLNLGNFEGCIQDASEGLACCQVSKESVVDKSLREVKSAFLSIYMLINRWFALQQLGRLESAAKDFKAICSGIHALSVEDNANAYQFTRGYLLGYLVRNKISRGVRPHYSREEGEKLEKTLGLGITTTEKRSCKNCGVETVNVCGGCKRLHICSKMCQKVVWTDKGHKHCCSLLKKLPSVIPLDDDDKAEIQTHVEKYGYCLLGASEGPLAICVDRASGRYFESLGNREIVFLPSELDLLSAYSAATPPADGFSRSRLKS